MRNLKKLLALVLAMVMTFSLMLTASAVDYKDYQDKDNITEEFKEAVQVLTGLKVFQGDEGGFRPSDTITRAEVAAIIYRMATGDVDGNQVKIYADYGNFTDVDRNEWYAGYVGYCQNAGYIKGTSATTFDPNGQVTGWQALAMILRAVGYDKNHEFEGSDWQVNVASLARELGITNNVKNANFETTLSYSARRDVVADLLFQTAVLVPTVTYTSALSYSDKISLTETRKNPTLGQKTFGLFCEGQWKPVDDWGTPGYYWAKGGTHVVDNSYNQNSSTYNSTYRYDDNWMPVYRANVVTNTKSKDYNVVATITPAPTKTYDTAGVHECDVAHDLDISTSETFDLYVNRNTPITTAYNIVATDTVTRVGGQGRETKFWYKVESKFAGKMDPWCTMVDTYLATVTNVTERVLDPAGHVIVPAYLYLDVYDGQAVGVSDKTDDYESTAAATPGDTVKRNTSEHRASKSTANWEYAKGDKVLVKGWTDYTQNDAAIDKATGTTPAAPGGGLDNGSGLNHLFNNTVEAANKAAFETNRLMPAGNNTSYPGDDNNKLTVVQKSEPVLGKQTVTYWNQGKHTVDGKDYNDQMTLFLDVAGTTTNTTFAWYFDTKGNLIGIDYVPDTVNYGVITSIWTSFNQGETNTDGTAKTFAKVLYADGTEATINIDKFLMGGDGTGSTNITNAAAGDEMQKAANTIELTPVYDYDGAAVSSTMKAGTAGAATSNAAAKANLYVAPVASVNSSVEKWTATAHGGYFGIIKGNLFKFEASADGKMTAIEVGGKDAAGNANDGKYVGHYNYGAANAVNTSYLYKNFAYISVDNGTNKIAWMDSETKIMVNDGTDDQNVKCYTLSTLPGDVNITKDTEIDWADVDNDGRAEYVYVTGTIEGTITYALFYYNGGAAQWNGVDKKGTAFGWLNGAPTTVEFDDETEFNLVKNSQAYAGHLFALELTNGVVSNVLSNGAANQPQLLWDYTNSRNTDAQSLLAAGWAGVKTEPYAAGVVFGLGSANSKNGNPYTATTEAIYYNDMATPAGGATAAGESQLTYDANRRSISVDGVETYFLTPNSKVVGLGMNVNQESAILDYLNHSNHNDVTIVYEVNAVKSIVEIYVATDPNVTPGGEVTADYTPINVQTVPAGVTALNVENIIKNMGPNTVVYSPNVKGPTAGTSNAKDVLYFPFNVTTAGANKGATLTVNRVGGNGTRSLAYQESHGTGDGFGAGAHFFVINFNGGPVSSKCTYQSVLSSGYYEFSIVDTDGTVLSSGNFTIVNS